MSAVLPPKNPSRVLQDVKVTAVGMVLSGSHILRINTACHQAPDPAMACRVFHPHRSTVFGVKNSLSSCLTHINSDRLQTATPWRRFHGSPIKGNGWGSVIKHSNANMHSKHIKFPKEAGFSVGGLVLLARLQKAFGIKST